MKLHQHICRVIPPGHNAEFVAGMEDVPEVYRRPYDPKRPVVCVDEQPLRLVRENRHPLPVKSGQPARYDDEYERVGTAVNFMMTEPLGDHCKVNVRTSKKSPLKKGGL